MIIGLCAITTAREGNPKVIILGKNSIVIIGYQNTGAFTENNADYLQSRLKESEAMGRRGRQLAKLYYGGSWVYWDILGIMKNSKSESFNLASNDALKQISIVERKVQFNI